MYVPGGTKPAYQATSSWKNFQNILPMAFEVTATATAGGSVKVNGGEAVSNGTESQWVDRETEVTFDVAEAEDYDLASVTLNGEDVTEQLVDGRLTVASLEDDVTVVATFAMLPHYTVEASAETLGEGVGGTVTVSNEVVISGRSCTVAITANEGYELKTVTVNGVDKTDEVAEGVLTLTNVTENQSVTATFQKQRFAVTATATGGGAVTLSASEAEWGSSIVVTLTPEEEHEFVSLTVNGVDATAQVEDGQYTIQHVESAIAVEAVFKEITEATIVFSSTAPIVYCSKHHLDFSQVRGLKAYILPTCNGQMLKAVEIENATAGTGLLLKAAQAGTYKVPYCEDTSYSLNLLHGTTEDATLSPTEGEAVNYAFRASDGSFQRIAAQCQQSAGTAWLQLPGRVAEGVDVLSIVYEASGNGDVNGDGDVTIADVTSLVNIIVGKE